jgi:hypothetical protein
MESREKFNETASIQGRIKMKLKGYAFSAICLLLIVPQVQALTIPQANAVRSATQYLSFSGFSRDGLINQLYSDAGDGYSVSDATFAVDSLNVDWNAQAVKSAKQYLSFSGFSCRGLIEQLSSSAGDRYTPQQAAYGAQAVGVCQ